MTDDDAVGERFMRFHALYKEALKSEFDALEFAEDDLYAFQVLDRAFRSDNQELRNLAAHLQTQREAALETITVRATEINESTRKMKTLELKVLERSGISGDISSAAMAAGGEPGHVPMAAAKDGSSAASGEAPAEPEEREPGGRARRRKGWFG